MAGKPKQQRERDSVDQQRDEPTISKGREVQDEFEQTIEAVLLGDRSEPVSDSEVNRLLEAVRRLPSRIDPITMDFAEEMGRAFLHADLLGRSQVADILKDEGEIAQFSEPTALAGQFTPDEAFRWISEKISITRPEFDALSDELQRQAFTIARTSNVETVERVRKFLERKLVGTPSDPAPILSKRDFIDQFKGEFSTSHLETTFRTNVHSNFEAGKREMLLSPSNRSFVAMLEIVTARDFRVREDHKPLHGFTAPPDDPIWRSLYPPFSYNCFPAGVAVQGRVEGGSKVFYSGKMIELTTAAGRTLPVTQNHPVLTKDRGFVAAGEIQEGDYLVSYEGGVEPVEDLGIDNAPARIEEVFESLKLLPVSPREVNSAFFDFYGDGEFCKGEIEIIDARGVLRDVWNSSVQEHFSNENLPAVSDGATMPRLRLALFDGPGISLLNPVEREKLLDRLRADSTIPSYLVNGLPSSVFGELVWTELSDAATPTSLPGGGALALDGPSILFEFLPFEELRIGSASDLDTSRYEVPAEDGATYSALAGKLLERHPGKVSFDQVVKVRDYEFSDHVYDLQSPLGWIVAENIVVSNCRCSVVGISQRALERRGIKPSSPTHPARRFTPEFSPPTRTLRSEVAAKQAAKAEAAEQRIRR